DRQQSDIVNNIGRGIFPGLTNFSAAVQTFTNEGQNLVKDFSLFAQEEFLTLSERLLVTAGVNSERSSNNGDQQKFYAYPKFSASYRIPEMIPRINEFKLRLAYGRAGNQPTAGRFTFLTTLFNEGRTGLRASTVKGAKGIKPETASEIEGGFDMTGFDGRLRLSGTQARKQIDNLLLTAAVAPSTGFTTQFINGGQIVNRITEIELGLTPIQRGNFEWVSNTTYASVRGKVTRLPVPGFIAGPGSFGSRFGNGFIGQGLSPSIVQAVNGCKALSTDGLSCASANRILTFVGDGLPDYVMGFSNDFTLGAFRFSSLLDWRKGSVGVNLTNNYFDGGLLADTATGNQRIRDFRKGQAVYVESTGFLKLREATVGYELPSRLTSSLFNGRASAARVELSGRNLWTKTKYTGLDPEVSNFGNGALGRVQDVTPYPPARSFFFVVRTTF
ncbi:MAG: TonB-dependent receptor, partial [Gemmatimonadaceae bacterium]|nr:TonB-dependent receptor [Gemmatimonadaceae bacterium]